MFGNHCAGNPIKAGTALKMFFALITIIHLRRRWWHVRVQYIDNRYALLLRKKRFTGIIRTKSIRHIRSGSDEILLPISFCRGVWWDTTEIAMECLANRKRSIKSPGLLNPSANQPPRCIWRPRERKHFRQLAPNGYRMIVHQISNVVLNLLYQMIDYSMEMLFHYWNNRYNNNNQLL